MSGPESKDILDVQQNFADAPAIEGAGVGDAMSKVEDEFEAALNQMAQ